MIGHGKRMQDQGRPQMLEELHAIPEWTVFYRDYVRRNRPVVLRGIVKSQHAFSKWTDEHLSKHWGDRIVNIEVNKTETRGGPTTRMRFRQFLKEIYEPEREGQLYAIVDFDADLQARSDFELPAPIRCKEIVPQSMTLWISSGGTTSVLHHDDAENVLMLLAGKKSVMLVHQDQAQNVYAPIAEHQGSSPVHQDAVDLVVFPRFANISWIYGEISAGDMLYIPHTYWHQVNSYDRNLAVNLWWQHVDDWRWWDPSNKREYHAPSFGKKGWISFDELKQRAPATAKCTPVPADENLSKTTFMDENQFKKHARKMRKSAKQRGEL